MTNRRQVYGIRVCNTATSSTVRRTIKKYLYEYGTVVADADDALTCPLLMICQLVKITWGILKGI